MAEATSVDATEQERIEEGEREAEGERPVEEEGVESSSVPTASSVSLSQSTLVPFRTPVLPNLAKAALERLQKRNSEHDDDESQSSDFQPVKKRKMEESGAADEDQEGQTCSICFEPWSNSGSHRISSLKCGHLFGLNCIEKWIKGGGGGKCPQCNAPAKKGDIRVIYSKAISVVDTTDKERALKELEEEKRLRISAQKAEAQAVVQYQLARTECDRLKEELRQLKEQLEHFGGVPPSSRGTGSEGAHKARSSDATCERDGMYILTKTIKISECGKARVMTYDPLQSMIVVSKPSTSALVQPYGVVKLSTIDLRHSEYVGIHGEAIRDVAFSPRGDGMILTASMDKFVRLTSMHANSVVQGFQVPVPAWACTWDHDDANYFCCGLQNGKIRFYDIRNTSSHVTELVRPEGGVCPITSLSFVPLCRASTLNCAGLVVGSLNGCSFWEKDRSEPTSYNHHALHSLSGGACMCVSFEPYTRHCLASFRPSRRCPHTRHALFQLHNIPSDQPLSSHLVHEFQGGPVCGLLSRSKLFQRPKVEGEILAAFGDEASKSVHLWDVTSTTRLQQLPMVSNSTALDLLPFGSANEELAVLTESKLFTYKWQRRLLVSA